MSSTTNIVQYNIQVSCSQPSSGSDYGVDLTLQQTATFQDADAIAMYNAQLAVVPASWGTPLGGLNKVTTDMTQLNYSASTGTFS